MTEEKIKEAAKKYNARAYSPFDDPYEMSREFEHDCNCFKKGAQWALSNQWISVEEDLPPLHKVVIGMDYFPELAWEDQPICFVHRSKNPDVLTDKNKFCVYPPRICEITHWMEIPSLKGGE